MTELIQAKLTERDQILEMIRRRLTYYAEDLFSPITLNEVPSRDRVGAQMARFLLKSLIEEIEGEG